MLLTTNPGEIRPTRKKSEQRLKRICLGERDDRKITSRAECSVCPSNVRKSSYQIESCCLSSGGLRVRKTAPRLAFRARIRRRPSAPRGDGNLQVHSLGLRMYGHGSQTGGSVAARICVIDRSRIQIHVDIYLPHLSRGSGPIRRGGSCLSRASSTTGRRVPRTARCRISRPPRERPSDLRMVCIA